MKKTCSASTVVSSFVGIVRLIASTGGFRSANMYIKMSFDFKKCRSIWTVPKFRFSLCSLPLSFEDFTVTTYKINGEKAVHLNPRPQAKDAKPSTKSKTGAACEACRRYLQDPPNRFCSIACKVSAVDVKPKDQSHKMELSIQEYHELSWKENQNLETSSEDKQSSLSSTDLSEEETKTWLVKSLKPRKRLHKRKGTPLRAPLT
ncbi:hypothetical protein GOBAR_DD29138 [Gossypium barbadense]|nr:hypothetical protein GOBAR_DD29138 [Gossypium barbadense]